MVEESNEEREKLIWCDRCKRHECLEGYAHGKPKYCRAIDDPGILEAMPDTYLKPETAKYHRAASTLIRRQKEAGVYWTRIQESIEFAKELEAHKVGIAVCSSMRWQGAEFAELLRLAGLEPCMVNCMAGGMSRDETGIPKDWPVPPCNPVIQADILNRAGTELNFIYGLCVGHDTLFIQHSKAPVTVVVSKDRVTVNNPGAVLFSFYHRKQLWSAYGGEPDNSVS